jgi:hypothetical protein
VTPDNSPLPKSATNSSGAKCAPVILVTGSRTWTPEQVPQAKTIVERVLGHWLRVRFTTRPEGADKPVLRHGGAKGLDTLAAQVWTSWGLPTDKMRPDWTECGDLCDGTGKCRIPVAGGEYCSNAGYQRNHDMVDKQPYPEVCFAFIHNNSNGATDCADYAEERGVPVRRYLA